MGNPVSDFMGNWLNTTYQYLKETGGPTYGTPVTVGPNVLPTGPYTPVEDLPSDYYAQPIVTVTPLPFNPDDTGLAPIAANRIDAVEEEAKQTPTPNVFSDGFAALYNGMMKACISDQKDGHNNPNATRACKNLAESGNVSEMILTQAQKTALGMKIPPGYNEDKTDEVRKAENAESLTGQIREGAGSAWAGMAAYLAGSGVVPAHVGTPEGANFQNLGDKLAGFIPKLPGVPQVNTDMIVMVGASILVLGLVVMVFK